MKWRHVVRVLLWTAAVLGLAATVYVLAAPVQVHEVTAVGTEGGISQTETIRQASWFQVQGAWGVIVVSLLGGLYGLTAFFGLRGNGWAGVGSGAVAGVLTLLASLSVGPLYLPALLMIVLAGIGGLAAQRQSSRLQDAAGG